MVSLRRILRLRKSKRDDLPIRFASYMLLTLLPSLSFSYERLFSLQKIEANDQDEEPSNQSSQKIAGFLRLLLHLRKVLLQDSVCLRKVQPDHIIFNHPIFYSQEYRTFESSTLQIQALRSQIPSNEVLRRMGPSVDAFQSDMSQRLLGVHDLLQKDDLVPVMVGMSELFTRYTQFTQQLSATKASADAQAEVEAAQAQAASTSMSTARDDNSNEVTSNASSSNGFTFFNGSVDQASGSGSGSGGSNSLGFARELNGGDMSCLRFLLLSLQPS